MITKTQKHSGYHTSTLKRRDFIKEYVEKNEKDFPGLDKKRFGEYVDAFDKKLVDIIGLSHTSICAKDYLDRMHELPVQVIVNWAAVPSLKFDLPSKTTMINDLYSTINLLIKEKGKPKVILSTFTASLFIDEQGKERLLVEYDVTCDEVKTQSKAILSLNGFLWEGKYDDEEYSIPTSWAPIEELL